jgi:hypothetical protein
MFRFLSSFREQPVPLGSNRASPNLAILFDLTTRYHFLFLLLWARVGGSIPSLATTTLLIKPVRSYSGTFPTDLLYIPGSLPMYYDK